MYMTLRNGENVLIESTRHKVKINADTRGDISYDVADKNTKINDIVFEKQLKDMLDKNIKHGWGKERLKPMTDFIKNLVNRGSKALKIDKNKLFSLMVEECDYSAINYFQQANFYDFKKSDELELKISEINQQLWNLKEEHKKEIIKLQKEITDAKKFEVDKVEVDGKGYSDWKINVNCPFCDKYQEVEELGDWCPNDGEFEGNQECDGCGKIFSVKFDGDF